MNGASHLDKIKFEQKFRKFFVYRNEKKYVILCCNKKKENSRILLINRESKQLDVALDSFRMRGSTFQKRPKSGSNPKKERRFSGSSAKNTKIKIMK